MEWTQGGRDKSISGLCGIVAVEGDNVLWGYRNECEKQDI